MLKQASITGAILKDSLQSNSYHKEEKLKHIMFWLHAWLNQHSKDWAICQAIQYFDEHPITAFVQVPLDSSTVLTEQKYSGTAQPNNRRQVLC